MEAENQLQIPEIGDMPYRVIPKNEIAVRDEIRALLKDKDNGNRSGEIYYINPNLIDFLEGFNPREEIDYNHAASLSAQIKQQGQIEPGILLPRKDGRFYVVEGHHRKVAIDMAIEGGCPIQGFKCVLLPANTTEVELVLITLMANIKKQLAPIEAARQFGILKKYGWTDKSISDTFGLSYQFVNGAMILNEQAPVIKDAVKDGRLSTTTAIALARTEKDPLKRVEKFREAETKAAGGKIKAKDLLTETFDAKREKKALSLISAIKAEIALTEMDGDTWERLERVIRENY